MNLASLGNFFGPDMLIIFVVILLLFGAKKLPELAKGMGQAVREFSKAKDDIEREVSRAAEPPRALYEPKTEADLDHREDMIAAHHGDATAPAAQPDALHADTHVESEVVPAKSSLSEDERRGPTHAT